MLHQACGCMIEATPPACLAPHVPPCCVCVIPPGEPGNASLLQLSKVEAAPLLDTPATVQYNMAPLQTEAEQVDDITLDPPGGQTRSKIACARPVVEEGQGLRLEGADGNLAAADVGQEGFVWVHAQAPLAPGGEVE